MLLSGLVALDCLPFVSAVPRWLNWNNADPSRQLRQTCEQLMRGQSSGITYGTFAPPPPEALGIRISSESAQQVQTTDPAIQTAQRTGILAPPQQQLQPGWLTVDPPRAALARDANPPGGPASGRVSGDDGVLKVVWYSAGCSSQVGS